MRWFTIKNYLGNARVSFGRTSAGALEIVDSNDYYPFGMEYVGFQGANTQLPSYTYGFQGQEKQTETGWSSFKWRNSIPELGRFFNVDPLSEKYSYQSHYNFSENRVVDGRELEGLEVILVKDSKKNEGIIKAANNGLYKDNQATKTIHIFAHGGPKAFFNENVSAEEKKADLGTVKTGANLNSILNEASKLWKDSESKNGFTLVLHSCRTGRYTLDDNGNVVDPVASEISKSPEMEGVTIVAPDERDGFTADGREIGPQITKNANHNGDVNKGEKPLQTRKFGYWNSFKNGERINKQPGNTKPQGKDQRSFLEKIFN